MFYTIYKITNNINQKFYIGKHQTKDLDDGYFGSGKLIRAAIKKYGIENFSKEILFVFDNEQEMNAKEKELVVINEQSYNLCEGGTGGFGYINSHPDKYLWVRKGRLAANKIMSQQLQQKAKQKYFLNPKFCPNCKKLIEYKKRENKFCNHSCAAIYTNPIKIYKN